MKKDAKCAARKGCAPWLVLASHERGAETRARTDCYGDRVFSTLVDEAEHIFKTACQTTAEQNKE